ncbi:MAG TPA: efflux RND transporter periplasmic adaptor subunit [Methyloceanibacter sp.]|nr:efflux RND transporter periplasmic adaptor subunit [Methyloceanibacter sp.]
MIKRFIIAAVIVALFLGGVGYFQFVMKPKFIGDFMAKMVPPPATVTTEKAKTAIWADQVHSIGTLIAIQGVDVAPEVGGVVVNYFFDSGQDVEKGAKLVELDNSVQQAELKVDQAILEVAKLEYERQSKLVGKGAISQSTLDTTISKRDAAAAAVQKNLAHIAHKNITAPFAGRLGLRRVERGQYVSAGQTLVWLQALDPIWIDFPVAENEMGRLKPKAEIELSVAAYPGQVFKGEIEAFDARVNQETRQLMVRGRLPNPERKLLPGMFANVAVVAGEAKTLVSVPRTAVTYGLYGDSVWVAKEAQVPGPAEPSSSGEAVAAIGTTETKLIAERRFVRLGQSQGETVAIVEGINEGDDVVTSGQLKLQPGAAIKIDNSSPLQSKAERPKQ